LELLEDRVYNKPNGCSAAGTLALGPDHQKQQQQQQQQKQQETVHSGFRSVGFSIVI
jgi:hypothetical protein